MGKRYRLHGSRASEDGLRRRFGGFGVGCEAAVLKSVGRAAPGQWLKALTGQRDAPQWGRPSLDRLSEQQLADLASSQTGLFVPRGGTSAVSVKAARSPAPDTSFGFVDVFASVDAKVDFLDGFVVLKTSLRSLSHVQPESLRLFRWDPQRTPLHHSAPFCCRPEGRIRICAHLPARVVRHRRSPCPARGGRNGSSHLRTVRQSATTSSGRAQAAEEPRLRDDPLCPRCRRWPTWWPARDEPV